MITSMKQAIVDGQLCFFETLKRKNERRKDKSRSVVCSSKKETKKLCCGLFTGNHSQKNQVKSAYLKSLFRISYFQCTYIIYIILDFLENTQKCTFLYNPIKSLNSIL